MGDERKREPTIPISIVQLNVYPLIVYVKFKRSKIVILELIESLISGISVMKQKNHFQTEGRTDGRTEGRLIVIQFKSKIQKIVINRSIKG